MPTSHGFRRKTRSLLKQRSRIGLSRIMNDYELDDRVVIDIDRSKMKSMPHRRFQGMVGIVKKVERRGLIVTVQMGGKIKKVITRFDHVRPLKGAKKND